MILDASVVVVVVVIHWLVYHNSNATHKNETIHDKMKRQAEAAAAGSAIGGYFKIINN